MSRGGCYIKPPFLTERAVFVSCVDKKDHFDLVLQAYDTLIKTLELIRLPRTGTTTTKLLIVHQKRSPALNRRGRRPFHLLIYVLAHHRQKISTAPPDKGAWKLKGYALSLDKLLWLVYTNHKEICSALIHRNKTCPGRQRLGGMLE